MLCGIGGAAGLLGCEQCGRAAVVHPTTTASLDKSMAIWRRRCSAGWGALATMSDRGVVSLQGDSRTHGWGISIKKEGRRPSLVHFDCARRVLLLLLLLLLRIASLPSLALPASEYNHGISQGPPPPASSPSPTRSRPDTNQAALQVTHQVTRQDTNQDTRGRICAEQERGSTALLQRATRKRQCGMACLGSPRHSAHFELYLETFANQHGSELAPVVWCPRTAACPCCWSAWRTATRKGLFPSGCRKLCTQ